MSPQFMTNLQAIPCEFQSSMPTGTLQTHIPFHSNLSRSVCPPDIHWPLWGTECWGYGWRDVNVLAVSPGEMEWASCSTRGVIPSDGRLHSSEETMNLVLILLTAKPPQSLKAPLQGAVHAISSICDTKSVGAYHAFDNRIFAPCHLRERICFHLKIHKYWA